MAVLAAAQCAVQPGDLAGNLALHLALMQRAREQGVDFLLFPELSLTGYEPTLAHDLAQTADTSLLAPLRALAKDAGMTTVVGLPMRPADHGKPQIAAYVLHGDGSLSIYTKQYLHPGEEQFFAPGTGGELLSIAGLPVALSVCADFTHAEHLAAAAAQGAQVYATGVLIGEAGYGRDSALLQGHAQHHGMAILMANHGGPTGGWQAAGQSAFWDNHGRCVASTTGLGNRLLILCERDGGWHGKELGVAV
ncbi:MAG: carbon-nitrogen hydrolase family protein [Pseudomonas sp.]